GSLENDAWAVADTFDPDDSDNRAVSIVTVDTEADLSLNKFAIGSFVAGRDAHYEIQVSNAGPSVSRNVNLRDFLPAGVEFLNAFLFGDGNGEGLALVCDVAVGSNVVACPLGDIVPGGGLVVILNVHVAASVTNGTNLTNSADVLLISTTDPGLGNNSDSASVISSASADLSITKTASALTPFAGSELTYTIAVTNNGPSTATGVTVSDSLPAGVTYEQDSLACGAALSLCPLGALQPGESKSFTVVVLVDEDVIPGTQISNMATTTSAVSDPDSANNSSTAQVRVRSNLADLSITKLDDPDPVIAGQVLTYTLTVFNDGAAAARNVKAEDYMPAGVDMVSVTPDVGNCQVGVPGNADRPTVCNLGTVASGGTVEIEIVAEVRGGVADGKLLFNDAQVTSESVDGNTPVWRWSRRTFRRRRAR
ncbi:MAG: DUF11 domain-containing protein, partial [Chloroflexi bacterium]|nr:DUF11 domain-containing protein [Chloroflexota bacterium]